MSKLFDDHSHQVFSRGFYRDKDFDFVVRCVLGGAAYGNSEVGEVLATIDGVPGGDHQKWFDAWLATGHRLKTTADDARAAGFTASAAAAYLRAATYFAVAVDAASALKDDSELVPTFRLHRSSWDAWVDTCGRSVQRVSIPYEGAAMPGYFFRPADDATARPTYLMVNGSDGAISDLWSSGAAAALERGYNVLMFDGPGQQSMLFENGVGFRPDWGPVLTPAVDFLLTLAGVDPDRLVVYGLSQGGYWVPTALVAERRFAAAVLDPGVVRIEDSWTSSIPKALMKLFNQGKKEAFNRDMALGMKVSASTASLWKFRARPYRGDNYFDTLTDVQRYVLASDELAQITTPMLLTAPEHEQFWPGQSAEIAKELGGASQVVEFTAAEGADFHCQPMARNLVHARIFDWLDRQLAAR